MSSEIEASQYYTKSRCQNTTQILEQLIDEPGFNPLGRMRVFGAPCVATVIWAHSGVRRDGHHKVKNVERIYGKTDTG
jgi:hypothetical protein